MQPTTRAEPAVVDHHAPQSGSARHAAGPVSAASAPRARRTLRLAAAVSAAAVLAGCASQPRHAYHAPPPAPAPQPMYFYPEREQSAERQDRDRYECYRWAVRETNYDPGMRPVQQSGGSPPPVRRDPGAAVAGGVTGAVVGAAVSSPRNVGAGLVLGAIFGSMVGAAAEESRAEAVDQAREARRREWDARQQVPIDNFRRAMTACMTGRGYAVR